MAQLQASKRCTHCRHMELRPRPAAGACNASPGGHDRCPKVELAHEIENAVNQQAEPVGEHDDALSVLGQHGIVRQLSGHSAQRANRQIPFMADGSRPTYKQPIPTSAACCRSMMVLPSWISPSPIIAKARSSASSITSMSSPSRASPPPSSTRSVASYSATKK